MIENWLKGFSRRIPSFLLFVCFGVVIFPNPIIAVWQLCEAARVKN